MTPVFIRPCAISSKTTLNDAMKTLQVFNPCIGLATLTSILHLLPPTSNTRRSHQMLSNPRKTGRPCARHNYMDKTSNLTIYAFLATVQVRKRTARSYSKHTHTHFVQMQYSSLSTQLALQEIKFLGVHHGSPHFYAFLQSSKWPPHSWPPNPSVFWAIRPSPWRVAYQRIEVMVGCAKLGAFGSLGCLDMSVSF